MPRYSEKAKLIAAAVFGGVVVLSGAATAATGSIPLVHGHSHQPSTHTPDGTDDDQGTDVTDSTDTETPDADTDTDANTNDNKGSSVSQLAHDTAPGPDHGKTVCNFASGGRCVHDENNATTHGKAGANTNATTHRQNGLTTHGQAGQHGNTSTP